MKKAVGAMLGSAVFAMLASACTQQDAADRFREPLPKASDARLNMPGSQVAGSPTQSATVHIQGGGSGSGDTGYAQFYALSRDLADGVDFVTLLITGTIGAITGNPPTTIDAKSATWGPAQGDALSPVMWKLVVTEVGDREFDYELDGRPHLSNNEADWRPILTGHGWGANDPNHRSGWFQFDNDAYRALDPQRGHDSGTARVTFDARTWPINIEASVKPGASPTTSFDVTVVHEKDGGGTVLLNAVGDIDQPKDGDNENLLLNSRWTSTGAGRADVKISGGSLGTITAFASECWSNTFARTYYTDNVNYRPAAGDATTCVYSQAQFPQ
jgi:hypothetical protein